MVYTPHQVVKPEVLVQTAAAMLEEELVVPNLFQKEGIDQFKGAEDDTVSVKVEGVLPFHEYAFRNNRANPIEFDVYAEKKVAVTFGGNFYSGVVLTDEQADFDLTRWATLLTPQVKAVARGLARGAVSTLTKQTYTVQVGKARNNLRAALIEARRVLNAYRVPSGARTLLVGTDFESALLSDKDLNLAQNVGEAQAVSALTSASIGQRYGFNIVVDPTIAPGDAYAMVPSAFIFLSGAPSVPDGAAAGSTTSFEGVALRWLRDYDPARFQGRSVVNTYAGFRSVPDILVGWDETKQSEVVSDEHFVRAIKVSLDGASSYPAVASPLSKITQVNTDNAYPKAERTPTA